VDEGDIEALDIPTFVREEELRKVLLSLINMSLARHMVHTGLCADDSKLGRYFFPSKDGGENVITWTPRKKRASRTVAKPVVKDGKTLFWRHLGAYLQVIFLVGRFYLKISPTWVITDDGRTPSGGPDIGKRVSKWTNPNATSKYSSTCASGRVFCAIEELDRFQYGRAISLLRLQRFQH